MTTLMVILCLSVAEIATGEEEAQKLKILYPILAVLVITVAYFIVRPYLPISL